MEFEEIPFYNGVGYSLDSKLTENFIVTHLNRDNLNLDQNSFKTISHKYFKFLKTDEDISYLKKYTHALTVNYGFNDVWLLWLTTIDGGIYTFYINLKKRIVIRSFHRFSRKLYSGTLFEGEFVNNEFVIFDIIIYNNIKLDKNIHYRIEIIRTILSHLYVSDSNIENLKITVRPYTTYQYIQSFIEKYVFNCPSANGICFIPFDKSSKCYTLKIDEQNYNPELIPANLRLYNIKFEPFPTDNEFRGKIKKFYLSPIPKLPDNFYSFSVKNGELIQRENMIASSLEMSKKINEYFDTHEGCEHSGISPLLLFKCVFVEKFRKWQPFDLCEM